MSYFRDPVWDVNIFWASGTFSVKRKVADPEKLNLILGAKLDAVEAHLKDAAELITQRADPRKILRQDIESLVAAMAVR